jgi:hypothetical protein
MLKKSFRASNAQSFQSHPSSRGDTQTPLRFAVLLEGGQLNQWQAECVSRLIASGTARLELVIHASSRMEWPLRRVASLVRNALWRAYIATQHRKVSTGTADPKVFSDVEAFACKAFRLGGLLELGDPETARIRSKRFDFILHFGESTPADSLATVAAHGIWCFKYGDALDTAGPLAAFRATFLCRDNLVRAGLVSIAGGHEANRHLLRDGYFAVPDYSFKKTLAGMLSGSVDFPVLACRNLLAGREFAKNLDDSPSTHQPVRLPGNAVMLNFLICLFAQKPVNLFRAILTREQWNSGFLDSKLFDPFSIATARNVRWLPTESAKDFAADPFFLRRDDKLTLLFEKLDPVNNCGKIAARQIDEGEMAPLGIVIDEPFHSSYPCLIQSNGQIYCVPEQAESKSIMLYRAINFPLRWERVGPLLQDIEAVDSTLFQHGGYWWLAYTDASIDRNGRLMLWYATELTGSWQPHALNPVKIDPRCSRGAGPPFAYRGALIRPSQDCSVTYGAKINFNHVITLTPTQFHEEVVGELRPDPAGPYSLGLHTISYDGSVAVVDGKRALFDLAALPPKRRSHLRRDLLARPQLAANQQFSLASSTGVRSASNQEAITRL